MIKSIQTINFKALAKADVEFELGLNILKGPNGVGKSSLMQALKFAFYGVAAVPGKKASIPTWGKKKAEVILTLEDGHQIHRTTTDCTITLEGAEVATGNKPCSEYIADHFDLDLKGFEMFHFSNQGETAALLTLGATELQRRVESHSGVAVIDGTIKRARSGALGLSATLEAIDNPTKEDIKGYQQQLEAANDELQLASEAAVLSEGLQEAASQAKDNSYKELQQVRDANARAEKLTKRKERHEQNVTNCEQQLKYVREEIAQLGQLEEVEELEHTVEHLESELDEGKAINSRIGLARQRLPDIDSDLQHCDSQAELHAEWEKRTAELTDQMEAAQLAYQEAISDHTRKDVALQDAKKALQDAKKGKQESMCPTCQRPFEDHDVEAADTLLAQCQEAFEKASAEHRSAAAVDASMGKKIQKLKNEFLDHDTEEPQDFSRKVAELEAEKKNLLPDLDLKQVDTAKTKEELRSVQDTLAVLVSNHKKLARLYTQEIDLSQEIDELEEKIDELDIPNSMDEAIFEAAWTTANETYLSAKETALEAADMARQKEALSYDLQKELKALVTAQERAAELAGELSLTNKLVDYLVKSRERFMSEVWNTILGNASHFCSIATADWVGPSGRSKTISEITRKEGAFYFTEDGVTQPIESASGAQRAFMGVGVRLGMSVALKGSHSLLILDEPTSDMANENANALAGALLGLPGQVIMITHRAYEELSASNVVDLGAVA